LAQSARHARAGADHPWFVDEAPDRLDMEVAMRDLLERGELPQPDEVLPHENGGIVCLWHEQKVAIIVDPDDEAEDAFPV
jgi:hypothetical protein